MLPTCRTEGTSLNAASLPQHAMRAPSFPWSGHKRQHLASSLLTVQEHSTPQSSGAGFSGITASWVYSSGQKGAWRSQEPRRPEATSTHL